MSETINPYVRFGVAASVAFGSLMLEGCTENVEEATHERSPAVSSEATAITAEPARFIKPVELTYPVRAETECVAGLSPEGCVEVPAPDVLTLMVPESIASNLDQIQKASDDAELHMFASSDIYVDVEVVTIPDIDPYTLSKTSPGKICIDGIPAARAAAETLDQDPSFWGIVSDLPLCPSSLPIGADGEASIWDGGRYLAIDGAILYRTGDETLDNGRFSDVLFHEIKHLYGLGHIRDTECEDENKESTITAIRFEECVSNKMLVREYGRDLISLGGKGGSVEGMYTPAEPALTPVQVEALMEDSKKTTSHHLMANSPLELTINQFYGNDIVTYQLPSQHTYETDRDFTHKVVQLKFIAVEFVYPEISGVKIVPYFYDEENGVLTLTERNTPLLIRESDEVSVSIGDSTVTAKLLSNGNVSFTAN